MSPTPQGQPASFVDRRRSPRIEALGRISVAVQGGTVPVELYDIGAGGFSLVTDVPLEVNSVHRFVFRVVSSAQEVKASARVRYCRQFTGPERSVQFLSGLSFANLDAAGRAAVDRLIDSLTSTLSFD